MRLGFGGIGGDIEENCGHAGCYFGFHHADRVLCSGIVGGKAKQ